ncbi:MULTISPECIES: hypothetical protein [Nostoc]|nr:MULTISPECIES: hypothetical protein [Nostoc]
MGHREMGKYEEIRKKLPTLSTPLTPPTLLMPNAQCPMPNI